METKHALEVCESLDGAVRSMSQITRPICGFRELKHTFLHTSKARVVIQRLGLFGPAGKQNNELTDSGSGLSASVCCG